MSQATENLQNALKRAMEIRPKIGGFPYLAETLRAAGVTKNIWTLPSCEAVYLTEMGPVVQQGVPLFNGMQDIPPFDREALVRAIRTDQAGQSTFPEFLHASWKAGVIRYEVDFHARRVIYIGSAGEQYIEEYPAVETE